MFRSNNTFDKLLDRATSKFSSEMDLAAMVELNDLIIANKCSPSYAISAISKKLRNEHPNVVYKSLNVLDALVKNCGVRMYKEVASEKFIQMLAHFSRTTDFIHVRTKALELIQSWAHAFGKLPEYHNIKDMYTLLKDDGIHFPPFQKQSTVLFEPVTELNTFPDLREAKNCNRCRVQFGLLVKKHRCDKCGNIFCAKCTSNKVKVPGRENKRDKVGKVCDMCFDRLIKEPETGQEDKYKSDLKLAMEASMEEYRKNNGITARSTFQDIDKKRQLELEEEEKDQLMLAIAISKSEAEERERNKVEQVKTQLTTSSSLHLPSTSKSILTPTNQTIKYAEEDPVLARYMDRSYWETRRNYQSPTGPAGQSSTEFQPSAPIEPRLPAEIDDTDKFSNSLRELMELFVNRMRSNSSRGRHISNDSTVQNMFQNLVPMHNELVARVMHLDASRGHYEKLQDKLSQIKEARNALDELRNEHGMQRQRLAAEQKAQCQLQMQNKLMELRQKKQFYLRAQEEMALHQIQQEEWKLQANVEQQRMISNQFSSYIPPVPVNVYQQPQPYGIGTGQVISPASVPVADPYPQMPYPSNDQPNQYYPSPNTTQVYFQDQGQPSFTTSSGNPTYTFEPQGLMNPIPNAIPETAMQPQPQPQSSISVPQVSPQHQNDGSIPSSTSEPVVGSSNVSPKNSEILNSKSAESANTGTVGVRKGPSTTELITFD